MDLQKSEARKEIETILGRIQRDCREAATRLMNAGEYAAAAHVVRSACFGLDGNIYQALDRIDAKAPKASDLKPADHSANPD